jgi:hypothetical protein
MSFAVVPADADDEEEFMKSVREGDHKTVERMIEEGNIDPAMNDNEPLKTAIEVLQQNKKKVKRLEKDPDVQRFGKKELLEPAIELSRKNKKTLDALIKRVDPNAVKDMNMDRETKEYVFGRKPEPERLSKDEYDRQGRILADERKKELKMRQIRESAGNDKKFNALIQRERAAGNNIAADFLIAVRTGDHKKVERMIDNKENDVDPSMFDNMPWKIAVSQNDEDMIDALMRTLETDYDGKRVDPRAVKYVNMDDKTFEHVSSEMDMLKRRQQDQEERSRRGGGGVDRGIHRR